MKEELKEVLLILSVLIALCLAGAVCHYDVPKAKWTSGKHWNHPLGRLVPIDENFGKISLSKK